MDGTFYPKNDYRNYLAHHGVKGMHWGVRKQPVTMLEGSSSKGMGYYREIWKKVSF